MVTIHVGLGLGELHLVHALAGVPVEEGLAPEHDGELLRHTLEDFLEKKTETSVTVTGSVRAEKCSILIL